MKLDNKMLNRVRIILLLCFVFLFVGCSHPTKTSIIKKTPLSFEAESQFQTVDTYEIRRLLFEIVILLQKIKEFSLLY